MNDRKKDIIARIFAVLFCLGLFFIILFNSFQTVCFNLPRYEKSYKEWHIAENIGISQEELMTVTDEMLQYLLDKRADLDLWATINDEYRPVFDERETLHMVDVKDLFMKGIHWRMVAYGVVAVSFFVMAAMGTQRAIRRLPAAWFWVLGTCGSVLIAICIYFAVDFNTAFTNFHLLLFNNDLWLLDPNTEVLMMMFDSDFFFKCVMGIALRFVGGLALMSALCAILLYYFKKKKPAEQETADA